MSAPRSIWFRPMTLALGVLFGVLTVLTSYIPDTYRPWNFAAYGAIGLFLGARAGLLPALAIALGSKLAFDLFNFIGHDLQAEYRPMGILYVAFAVYPLFGLLLRKTEHPLTVVGVAALAGVPFFLVTNFEAWLGRANGRAHDFAGLMLAFADGVPFYKGTLAGDLVFSATLFAAHAVLSRTLFPAERLAVAADPQRA